MAELRIADAAPPRRALPSSRRAAIEDCDLDEARASIAEAREIGGESPELAELEDRLRAIEAPVATPARFRAARPLLVAGASRLLASVFLVGNRLWSNPGTVGAGTVPAAGSSARGTARNTSGQPADIEAPDRQRDHRRTRGRPSGSA